MSARPLPHPASAADVLFKAFMDEVMDLVAKVRPEQRAPAGARVRSLPAPQEPEYRFKYERRQADQKQRKGACGLGAALRLACAASHSRVRSCPWLRRACSADDAAAEP
jgi:hypothetical protein